MNANCPPWVLLALREIGTKEMVGDVANHEIVSYWRDARITPHVFSDEIAWCAAFAGAMLERSGFNSSRSGLARSYSRAPFVSVPYRFGAIAVYSSTRGAWAGHVGFALNARGVLLGGNQSDSVSVATYDTSTLVGYFWPKDCPL